MSGRNLPPPMHTTWIEKMIIGALIALVAFWLGGLI